MTVEERIQAAIEARHSTVTDAYDAVGEHAPSVRPEPVDWPFNAPIDYLAYWRAQAATSMARMDYAVAVSAADADLVAAIEAAIAEGAGE